MFKSAFGFLQKIGQAAMIPVAVLPVAGLLLGIGAAHFGFIPASVSSIMKESGDVIFAGLPLLFAIGVALGFTDNDGIAAIAATIGFFVMCATLGVMAQLLGIPTRMVMGIPSMQTGVFGGILAGGLAAALFKRFYHIELPSYLGFFAGKRFVPIVTALGAILLGVALSILWPPIQTGINALSHWAAVGNPRSAATLYGFVERVLVPFGLHHIWNVPFFFEMGSFTEQGGKVVTGDIARFFAGDPKAGILSGAFLFKMFGLPGAALAIWQTAKPEHRVKVGGIMVSAALTSFLTGITEPLEFTFLFAAPVLYVVHALLVASAQFVANTLGMHLGFTFSQGGIDYLMFNVLGRFSQRAWLVLLVGPLYGGLYYGVFRTLILRFNLKTPGREGAADTESETGVERARDLVLAFGGRGNIRSLGACITRLRVTVAAADQVDETRLKALGAAGVLRIGDSVQAVFGPLSENLKTDMESYLRTEGAWLEQTPAALRPEPQAGQPLSDSHRAQILNIYAALGGKANVKSLEALAATRLRVCLADPGRMEAQPLKEAGVKAVMTLPDNGLDLIVGLEAGELGRAARAGL